MDMHVGWRSDFLGQVPGLVIQIKKMNRLLITLHFADRNVEKETIILGTIRTRPPVSKMHYALADIFPMQTISERSQQVSRSR